MIKLTDIQNHLVKRLKDRFPAHTVYREENRTNPKVPAFYVDVRPLETTGRQRYNNKLVNVSIQYLSTKQTKRENLEMMEELESLFYLALKVYDRRLAIERLSIVEVDGVLTVNFTLDYNTDFDLRGYVDDEKDLGYGEGKTELMKELYYNEGDV